MLTDEAVSSRHAAVWTDGRSVYVQDLGSRNGVHLREALLSGTGRLGLGEAIVVGATTLRVREGTHSPFTEGSLLLEDLSSGHGVPFAGERLHIGDAPGAALRVAGVPEGVLLRISAEEVLLGVDDDTRPLRLGEPFLLGERSFVLRRVEGAPAATRDLNAERAAYDLDATLEGGPGPRAVVSDRKNGRSFTVIAENRATLLWVLGRRWAEDRAGGTSEDQAGWVSEGEALTRVWGRAAGGTVANLRVLVCRIRKEIREAGLDPWFLEHRSGHLRTRMGTVRWD